MKTVCCIVRLSIVAGIFSTSFFASADVPSCFQPGQNSAIYTLKLVGKMSTGAKNELAAKLANSDIHISDSNGVTLLVTVSAQNSHSKLLLIENLIESGYLTEAACK
jgi:hypothetical protein